MSVKPGSSYYSAVLLSVWTKLSLCSHSKCPDNEVLKILFGYSTFFFFFNKFKHLYQRGLNHYKERRQYSADPKSPRLTLCTRSHINAHTYNTFFPLFTAIMCLYLKFRNLVAALHINRFAVCCFYCASCTISFVFATES